jgi:hypothetical protein
MDKWEILLGEDKRPKMITINGMNINGVSIADLSVSPGSLPTLTITVYMQDFHISQDTNKA